MTSIVSLSHLKSDPAPSGREPWDDAPASSSDAQRAHFARIAHPGGKMTTNKEEALAKFLLKRQAGKAKLSAAQAEALDRALRGTAFEAGAEADDEDALTAVAREKVAAAEAADEGALVGARGRAGRGRRGRGAGRAGRGAGRQTRQPDLRDEIFGGGAAASRRGARGGAKQQFLATRRKNSDASGPNKRQRSLSLNDRIDSALSAR